MKTFVECSQIIIWVPTNARKRCRIETSGVSSYSKNECKGPTKKRSSVNVLVQHFDGREYKNDAFVSDDTSNGRGPSENSNGVTIEITQQQEDNENRRALIENDDIVASVIDILDVFRVKPRTLQSPDGKYTQFSFCLENYRVEALILLLQENGIGSTENTTVSMIPASLHLEIPPEEGFFTSPFEPKIIDEKQRQSIEDRLRKFYASIKSRVTVAVVIKRIRSSTLFTFDYVSYLFLASIIALLGLLQGSSVVIVASMLVSPIMGPILAIIFGCNVSDKELTKKGIRNGFISIGLCLAIGFIFGFLFVFAEGPMNQRDNEKFITKEMTQRGGWNDIFLDVCIAIASGAAAALSVLGENTSSMVGVAISASLLPPAVNAGFLCSAGLAGLMNLKIEAKNWKLYTLDLLTRGYEKSVNGNMIIECPFCDNSDTIIKCPIENGNVDPICVVFSLALMSLLLTMINIICILVFGWLVLWLKEVTPEKVPQAFKYFWKKDVKNHRKLGQPNTEFNQMVKNQAKEILGLEALENNNLQETFCQTVIEKIAQDADYKNISDLQMSKSNNNFLNPTDFSKHDLRFHKSTNIRTSMIAENIHRHSTVGLQSNAHHDGYVPFVWPTIDSTLFYQAELLIKTSNENQNFRQLRRLNTRP